MEKQWLDVDYRGTGGTNEENITRRWPFLSQTDRRFNRQARDAAIDNLRILYVIQLHGN